MGIWGTGIFANDSARDIRGDYEDLLRVGKSDEEAERYILEEHGKECIGTEDEPNFWFALAKSEWKNGRLSENVRAVALEWIERGGDIELWNESPKNMIKRAEALNQLRTELNSEMPRRKGFRKLKHMHSSWQPGDIICYPLIDSHKFQNWIGKYGLAVVASIGKFHLNRFEPDEDGYNEIVNLEMLNWFGDELIEELDCRVLKDFWDSRLNETSMQRARKKMLINKLDGSPVVINAISVYLYPGDEKYLNEYFHKVKVTHSEILSEYYPLPRPATWWGLAGLNVVQNDTMWMLDEYYGSDVF